MQGVEDGRGYVVLLAFGWEEIGHRASVEFSLIQAERPHGAGANHGHAPVALLLNVPHHFPNEMDVWQTRAGYYLRQISLKGIAWHDDGCRPAKGQAVDAILQHGDEAIYLRARGRPVEDCGFNHRRHRQAVNKQGRLIAGVTPGVAPDDVLVEGGRRARPHTPNQAN